MSTSLNSMSALSIQSAMMTSSGGREFLVVAASGADAPAVAAVRRGEGRAAEARLPDEREVRARQLAQQATPLGPRRVLGLDLLHPTVRRGGRRQDLPLSEGPHRVHEPLLLRRVEERLAARDAPAAGHGQVVEADGAEQAGVEAHVESLPSPRVAWFFFGTSAVRRKVMTRSSFWFRTRVSTVTVPRSPRFDSRVSSTVDSA